MQSPWSRFAALFVGLVAAGCTSAPQPSVARPPAEPPSRPITIVDAPPPTLAEPPPEPEPPAANPVLERLTADSETLREDAREIAKRQPLAVKIEAIDKLLEVGKEINARSWPDAGARDRRAEEAYDAMAEVGGDELADFLLSEAETQTLALPRRRAALVAAESALPGDAPRASRRSAIAAELVKLGAKEPKVTASVTEAAAVTGRLAPGFRRCYLRALETAPDLEVRFNLSLTVDGRGVVILSKADATPAKDLARCIEGIGRAALFSPLAGGGTTIVVPIAFTPNRIRTL